MPGLDGKVGGFSRLEVPCWGEPIRRILVYCILGCILGGPIYRNYQVNDFCTSQHQEGVDHKAGSKAPANN